MNGQKLTEFSTKEEEG